MKTIQELVDAHFISMCEKGDFAGVKHWLTSPDLTTHANINTDNGAPIISACLKSHISIIKYLLTSPDLKEHADIHLDNDMAFRFAFAKFSLQATETITVMHYLIMDYGIALTPTITKELERYPNIIVNKMIAKRNFNIYSNAIDNNTIYNNSIYNNHYIKSHKVKPKLFVVGG